MRIPASLALLALSGWVVLASSLAAQTNPDEKTLVKAIRAGKQAAGADPQFVKAVQRIDDLRGQLEFDAAGRLIGVDLASDRISVADVEVGILPALPNLKRLKLSGAITNEGARKISTITGLTELALQDSQIDNQGLQTLTRLVNLASLSLQRAVNLNDEGLEYLKRFPKLTSLALIRDMM